MKVISVEISKDKLLSLPPDECDLFLAIGHISNEINALTKMLYWAAGTPITNEAEEYGSFTMKMMFARLLAGRLYEAWVLFDKKFFGPKLSRIYESELDSQSANALQGFKKYFKRQNNPCNKIRNNFAFHYLPDEIRTVLPEIDDKLLVYLERGKAPNNLFYLSEVVVAHSMHKLLYDSSNEVTFDKLFSELLEVGAWFLQGSDGLLYAIIKKNGVELRTAGPEEVHFGELERFEKIKLPWFTDTTFVTHKTAA